MVHYGRDRAAPVLVLTFQLVRHRISFVVCYCVWQLNSPVSFQDFSCLHLIPLSLKEHWSYRHLLPRLDSWGFGDLISGLHTCTAHALSTESSPQSNTGCSELTFALCLWNFTNNVSYRVAIQRHQVHLLEKKKTTSGSVCVCACACRDVCWGRASRISPVHPACSQSAALMEQLPRVPAKPWKQLVHIKLLLRSYFCNKKKYCLPLISMQMQGSQHSVVYLKMLLKEFDLPFCGGH